MNVYIEKLHPGDVQRFRELIGLFADVFESENIQMPEENYLEKLLGKEDFFVFIASSEGRIVGGLTCYIMHQYYRPSPLVYIYDLAVATAHQRKGVGKLLIENTNEYCRSIGVEVVMVQADEEDDHAIRFYKETGATAQHVYHFEYPNF